MIENPKQYLPEETRTKKKFREARNVPDKTERETKLRHLKGSQIPDSSGVLI